MDYLGSDHSAKPESSLMQLANLKFAEEELPDIVEKKQSELQRIANPNTLFFKKQQKEVQKWVNLLEQSILEFSHAIIEGQDNL